MNIYIDIQDLLKEIEHLKRIERLTQPISLWKRICWYLFENLLIYLVF